jgi:hypothetical protein
MAYCTANDLYVYGMLPRGALAVPARLVAEADTSTDTLELDAHGFEDDQAIQFRAVGGGTLPSPIVEATTYYVISTSDWRFQVSATEGGAALDLTTTGSTFAVLAPLPIAGAIENASRLIDDMCPAHIVPFEDPVPSVVRITTAELAANELLAMTGGASASLAVIYDAAQKRIARWSRGVPVRGTNAPPSAQRAVSGTPSTATLPDWRRYGGIF